MDKYVTHKDMDAYALIILGATMGLISIVVMMLYYSGALAVAAA